MTVQEGARPTVVPPKYKGTHMPLSLPSTTRSSPATPPAVIASFVDTMSTRDPD